MLIKKNSSIFKYILINILFALIISLICVNILSSFIITQYDRYLLKNNDTIQKEKINYYAKGLQNIIEKENLSFDETLADDRFFSNDYYDIYLIDDNQNLYYLSQYSGVITRGLLLTTTISSFQTNFRDKSGAFLISYYYETLGNNIWFSLFTIIQSVLLFVFIFHIRMKKVYKEFETLTSGVEIIGKGNLTHTIQNNRIKEFSELSTNINQMAKSLNSSQIEKELGELYQKKLLSNISHDLRTPVTVITGYLEVILHNKNMSKEDKEKYVYISLKKSRELKVMLDDFFTYNKLMARDVKFSFLDIDLSFFLDQAINDYDLNIVYNNNHCNSKVNIDPIQFKRVLDNLFKNMVDHGDGDNKLTLKEESNLVVITLSNKCLTPVEGDSNRFFKRTLMGSKSRKGNGSGLGLAIVKETIEKMNGTIESTYQDSVFSIIIKFNLIR